MIKLNRKLYTVVGEINSCVKGSLNHAFSRLVLDQCEDNSEWGAVVRAAYRPASARPKNRPARTTNPIVPSPRWCGDGRKVRVNVTGNSTRAVRPHPSMALGLEQYRGCQMERAIFLRSPCRSYDKTEDWL
jgi:hypothetical protein